MIAYGDVHIAMLVPNFRNTKYIKNIKFYIHIIKVFLLLPQQCPKLNVEVELP